MKEMKANIILFDSEADVRKFNRPGFIHASVSAGPFQSPKGETGMYLLRAVYSVDDLGKALGLTSKVSKPKATKPAKVETKPTKAVKPVTKKKAVNASK